jgi:hypothetical protein
VAEPGRAAPVDGAARDEGPAAAAWCSVISSP